MSTTGLSARQAIQMVAVREISTRVKTRAFVLGNAVLLTLIVVGLTITAALLPEPGEPTKVGLVGAASQLEAPLRAAGDQLKAPVDIVEVRDAQAGKTALLEDAVEVYVVAKGDGFAAQAEKRLSPTLRAVLTSAVQQQAVGKALEARKVDPNALAKVAADAKLEVAFLEPPRRDADQRTALALAVVSLLYVQLFGNGLAVAGGVVVEKTTRVVELLLAAIKPVHLLAGKVLGIGVVGLLQLALFGGTGLAAGAATGTVDVTSNALVTFVAALGWYVLGYLFLGVLYAAAGSLVNKQEDVGSATAPLSVLVIAMFIVAQTSASDPSGQVSSIMSWIPPFSAILMPLRIAAGVTGWPQVVGTSLLMLASTAVLAVLAGRVYQASILRTGSGPFWSRKRKATA